MPKEIDTSLYSEEGRALKEGYLRALAAGGLARSQVAVVRVQEVRNWAEGSAVPEIQFRPIVVARQGELDKLVAEPIDVQIGDLTKDL